MTGHKKYIQFSGNMVQSPLKKKVLNVSWETTLRVPGFPVKHGLGTHGRHYLKLHRSTVIAKSQEKCVQSIF